MSFRLVPKSVTLNDLERRNGHYFASFQRILVACGALRKSSRSLSHLLMSSCFEQKKRSVQLTAHYEIRRPVQFAQRCVGGAEQS